MENHEQGLIHRLREGSHEAFRELVEQCQGPVFRLALELTGDWDDADDLSQQVFIKAHGALHRFRGDTKVISWLYRIMVNTHIDNCRRERARGRDANLSITGEGRQQSELCITHAVEDNPEKGATARHIQDNINRALENLAPQQRSVFILRHYHDLPLKEIASIMGLSTGSVKSQLFRAIRRLRDELAFFKAELGLEGES